MDNFFVPGQSFLPEADRTAELQQLARRQQLAEALQARAMQTPIQANSSKSAAWQALASLGQQFLAGKTQKRTADEEKKIREEVERTQQQNLETYLTARNGDGAKDALLRAMISRDPRLQELGKMDAQAMAQRAGFETKVVDKAVIRIPNSGGAVQKLYEAPRETFKDETIQGPGGPILVARNTLTNEPKAIDRTPRINVETRLDNKGIPAAQEALGKKVPEVIQAAQEGVIRSQESIEAGKRLLELSQDPNLLSGFASGPLTGLASLGSRLGITGPEAATTTQAALAEMAKVTLANVKKLPGPLSEKELPFLKAATSGDMDWTPETLQHLAGLSIASAHNDLMQSYKQYQSAASIPGAEQARSMYPIPALNHTLEEGTFADLGNGRVRYAKPLPGSRPRVTTPGTPAKSGLKVYNWN